MSTLPANELGDRIRRLRNAAGLSQADLENKTGIKREYISKLETGGLKNPTFKTMKKLAEGLGVDIVLLVTDDPQILKKPRKRKP